MLRLRRKILGGALWRICIRMVIANLRVGKEYCGNLEFDYVQVELNEKLIVSHRYDPTSIAGLIDRGVLPTLIVKKLSQEGVGESDYRTVNGQIIDLDDGKTRWIHRLEDWFMSNLKSKIKLEFAAKSAEGDKNDRRK